MVTAIIPGLALKIFLAFVPSIILTMNKFAGMVSLSQLDMGLVSRFFVFQVGLRGVRGAGGGGGGGGLSGCGKGMRGVEKIAMGAIEHKLRTHYSPF